MQIAVLVAISQPHAQAPGWWAVLVALGRWVCRLVGAAAVFAVFIGTLEIWKLQRRLPQDNRIRSQAARVALWGATILPLVCISLLILGLYTHMLQE